jgi:hypothetical protein
MRDFALVQNGSTPHTASYSVRTGSSLKQSGNETEHRPPLIADIKKEWSYESTSC